MSLRAIFQTRSALGNSPPLNTLSSSLGSDESADCQREVDISNPRCTRPNPQLKMLGVVITLFDKRTNISRDTHGQIRSVFGEVLFKTKISKNVRLEESPAYKETILTFAPKSPGAVEYKKLAAEVVQRVEESRVARHAEDAA